MKHLKKFENHNSLEGFDDISILKYANSILKNYKDGPIWNDIIKTLNNEEIDYHFWSDIDILIYYLENYDN